MKITFKNQVRVLTYHILGSLAMLLILFFVGFEKYYLIGVGGFWLLYSLPVLFLHREYYLKNKGCEVNVSDSGIIVRLENSSVSDFHELEKIVLYKSASLDKGAPILPHEYYYFSRIFLKSGSELVITCLMTPDLENELKKLKWVPLDRKYVFFASPYLHK